MTFARHLAGTADMPVPVAQPLAMPDQAFDRPFRDAAAPGLRPVRGIVAARVFVLGLPLLLAVWVAVQAWLGFAVDGRVIWIEGALAIGTAIACYWMAVSVATAILGLLRRPRSPGAADAGDGAGVALRVAILVPMYGEDARSTIGAAVALLASLPGRDHAHRFSLHVLSDSRDLAQRAAERSAMATARLHHPHLDLNLRHRAENTDYKSGNIRDWVAAEGGSYDAALILDADSVMGRSAVLRLAGALAGDPGCALIQSLPRVMPGDTVWQRLQSFASRVYGANLFRGSAVWMGNEGNFVGHNAILRLRAFAASAGLPHLSGPRPLGGVILSHDFVEAALLRRAGWGVRMLPEAADSHEGTPDHVPGYLRRDRRWCQGNMQHLRLLAMPGLHPVSRFHLLQGAVAYLSSVLWLALLILWAALAQQPTTLIVADAPVGPGALTLIVVVLLLTPKLLGLVAHVREAPPPRGTRAAFAGTALAELVVSVLIAPAMMLHQVRAVMMTLAGVDGGWHPHLAGRPGWRALARFHLPETCAGLALLVAIGAGVLTAWILPVAVCLVLTLPVSWLVARDVTAPRGAVTVPAE